MASVVDFEPQGLSRIPAACIESPGAEHGDIDLKTRLIG